MSSLQNRRRNERHPHRAHATVVYGNQTAQAHILNLSKRGTLIAVLEEHKLENRSPLELVVETSKGQLTLRGTVAHVKAHYLGLNCSPASNADQALLEATLDQINSSVLPDIGGPIEPEDPK